MVIFASWVWTLLWCPYVNTEGLEKPCWEFQQIPEITFPYESKGECLFGARENSLTARQLVLKKGQNPYDGFFAVNCEEIEWSEKPMF